MSSPQNREAGLADRRAQCNERVLKSTGGKPSRRGVTFLTLKRERKTPSLKGDPPKMERAKTQSFLEPLERDSALPTPWRYPSATDFELLAHFKITHLYFKPLSLWSFVTAAAGQ